MIVLHEIEVREKTYVILCIGIPNENNPKFGTYFEAVLDPNMVSPDGRFIRFDQRLQGGEVQGWQRIADLTVCEILGPASEYREKTIAGYTMEADAALHIRAVKEWTDE